VAVDRAYAGPTTVLVPSADVLTLAVDLPFPSRAQRIASLPFALEEAVAEPLATLHFALGTEIAPRRHVAGVVRHARMQSWIASLVEAEIEPAILMPDALALPLPPPGAWVVRTEMDRCLVRTDNGAGFALPLSALEGAWIASGNPRLIALGDPLPVLFAEAVDSDAGWLSSMDQPDVILPPLDLRQGPYEALRATSGSTLRTLGLVAGFGILAHIGLLGIDAVLLDRMADRKEAEARAALQAIAPATTPDEDVMAAADRVVPTGRSGGRPFTRLLAQTSGALPGGGAVAFTSATYAPGTLDLGVTVSDAATLDRAVQTLEAAGLTASAAPSGTAAGAATTSLTATLKVAAGAAG
jgi:general secretion pathway protein L